jgi:hypothetical protein
VGRKARGGLQLLNQSGVRIHGKQAKIHRGGKRPSEFGQTVIAGGSQFYSGAEVVAARLQETIDHHLRAGAVRVTHPKTIANLKCPIEQRRSIAAILARKYRKYFSELDRLADRSTRFVLDENAVNEIFRLLKKVKACKYQP